MNKKSLINKIDKRHAKLIDAKELFCKIGIIKNYYIDNDNSKINLKNLDSMDFDYHPGMDSFLSKKDSFILKLPKSERKETLIKINSYGNLIHFIKICKSLKPLKKLILHKDTTFYKDNYQIILKNDNIIKYDKDFNLKFLCSNKGYVLYKNSNYGKLYPKASATISKMFPFSNNLYFLYKKDIVINNEFQDIKINKSLIIPICDHLKSFPKNQFSKTPDLIKNYLIIQ